MLWKHWSGYYAVRHYDESPEREYNAIRQGAGLLDVSPLFKYELRGKDAGRLLDYVLSRPVSKLKTGRVTYLCWCDDDGKVLDDGTCWRMDKNTWRITSASPSWFWFSRHAAGLDVQIVDLSDKVAAVALQGPTSRKVLAAACDADLEALKFFGWTHATFGASPPSGSGQPARPSAEFAVSPSAAVAEFAKRDARDQGAATEAGLRGRRRASDEGPVRPASEFKATISRTGYTGDLGYEVWVDNDNALALWDLLMSRGKDHGIWPIGLDALDISRIEAGFILQGCDYHSAYDTVHPASKASPFELGLDWTVDLDREPFIGQRALIAEKQRGSQWAFVGLEIDWDAFEAAFDRHDLPPSIPTAAWRQRIPVFRGMRQVGYASSGAWSPTLKKNLALASVFREVAAPGTELDFEILADWERTRVPCKVVALPFYDPPRKKA